MVTRNQCIEDMKLTDVKIPPYFLLINNTIIMFYNQIEFEQKLTLNEVRLPQDKLDLSYHSSMDDTQDELKH